MDERSQASEGNSRKRLRAEDRSGTSYKLPTSPSMAHVRDTRPRSGNSSGPSDVMLPTTSENAPLLQPLHPPIPNFSAISQGAPRPNCVPTSTDSPNNTIYNVALPLPNPGRAHRFCQVCDHVNHVRRKLCENCGAPKPSAVRNAVGVRTANESDTSKDRRPRPAATETYGLDNPSQGYSRPMPYGQGASQSAYSRQTAQNFLPTEQRGNKTVDPVVHQAHLLTMRCPGDDIPLLGNTQRQTSSYQFPDSQGSQRLGMGQALCEPLINNFGPVQNQDPRTSRGQARQNLVHFNQKVFPEYSLDRDQLALPSMNGIPGQQPQQHQPQHQQQQMAYPGQSSATPRRSSQLDLSSHPSGIPQGGKGAEGGLAEEVISLSRSNFIPELEARQGASRFQGMQAIRQTKNDTTQQFPESLDGQGTTGYPYGPGQDFFPGQSQVRQEERITFDESRSRDGLAASDGIAGTKGNINLSRYMEHNVENVQRPAEERGRGTQGLATNRGDVLHTGQLHRVPEQTSSGHLDESGRQTDEGRFAIDSILMQHKNGRGNQD